MLRRKFLKDISGSIIGGFLPASITRLVFAGQKYGDQYGLRFTDHNGKKYNLRSVKKFNHLFISLKEFSQASGYGIFTNVEKRKSVLYVQDTKIKFAADNSFVIINNEQSIQILLRNFFDLDLQDPRNLHPLPLKFHSH